MASSPTPTGEGTVAGLAAIEARFLVASTPDDLHDPEVAEVWAALDDEERREWWAAWSGTVREEDPVPTEPWRAALVAAVIDRGRGRRRLTWLVTSLVLMLSVVLVTAGTPFPRDPTILLDVSPYAVLVVVLAAWDESRRRAFAARCRVVAALGAPLGEEPGFQADVSTVAQPSPS